MNKIKTVEGLKPWEVMKRASEGDPVAFKNYAGERDITECVGRPIFNWSKSEYFIIDTTAPEIDWSKFDWGFFNQYGGLALSDGHHYIKPPTSPPHDEFCADCVDATPFYYWPGGECPVPGNVEVEIILRDGTPPTPMAAGALRDWTYGFNKSEQCSGDIIAFRLTGNLR